MHEIDRLELGVRQPIAVVAVGVERRMNTHRLRCREQLCREAVLHQRLAAAQGEAPGHGFQAMAIFASSAAAFASVTGMPWLIVQVSGL